MTPRIVGDIAGLPASGFRSHSLWGWAAMAFMLMEGTAFALAGGAYIYLMSGAARWPLEGPPPDLFWGTLMTVLLLASLVPTYALSRAARRRDLGPTRRWAVIVFLLNAAALVIRAFEFPHLNVRWDQDGYGSITWAMMALHTTHLVTDFVDTLFVTLLLFTHTVDSERYSDVDDDAVYWAFVVLTWVPIYLLVYWAPRFGQ